MTNRRLFACFDPYDRSVVRTKDELEALFWEGHNESLYWAGHPNRCIALNKMWSAWTDLSNMDIARGRALRERILAMRSAGSN